MSTFHDHEDAEMERLLDQAVTPKQLFDLLDRCTSLEFQRIDSHILADMILIKLVAGAAFRVPFGHSIEQYIRCVKEEWWHA